MKGMSFIGSPFFGVAPTTPFTLSLLSMATNISLYFRLMSLVPLRLYPENRDSTHVSSIPLNWCGSVSVGRGRVRRDLGLSTRQHLLRLDESDGAVQRDLAVSHILANQAPRILGIQQRCAGRLQDGLGRRSLDPREFRVEPPRSSSPTNSRYSLKEPLPFSARELVFQLPQHVGCGLNIMHRNICSQVCDQLRLASHQRLDKQVPV